jgi:hypothetical protein
LIVPHSGQLAKFNDGNGGLHHCAYRVEDLQQFMLDFNEGRGRWLFSSPVRGARGMIVNFISPRYLQSLTEFVEEQT